METHEGNRAGDQPSLGEEDSADPLPPIEPIAVAADADAPSHCDGGGQVTAARSPPLGPTVVEGSHRADAEVELAQSEAEESVAVDMATADVSDDDDDTTGMQPHFEGGAIEAADDLELDQSEVEESVPLVTAAAYVSVDDDTAGMQPQSEGGAVEAVGDMELGQSDVDESVAVVMAAADVSVDDDAGKQPQIERGAVVAVDDVELAQSEVEESAFIARVVADVSVDVDIAGKHPQSECGVVEAAADVVLAQFEVNAPETDDMVAADVLVDDDTTGMQPQFKAEAVEAVIEVEPARFDELETLADEGEEQMQELQLHEEAAVNSGNEEVTVPASHEVEREDSHYELQVSKDAENGRVETANLEVREDPAGEGEDMLLGKKEKDEVGSLGEVSNYDREFVNMEEEDGAKKNGGFQHQVSHVSENTEDDQVEAANLETITNEIVRDGKVGEDADMQIGVEEEATGEKNSDNYQIQGSPVGEDEKFEPASHEIVGDDVVAEKMDLQIGGEGEGAVEKPCEFRSEDSTLDDDAVDHMEAMNLVPSSNESVGDDVIKEDVDMHMGKEEEALDKTVGEEQQLLVEDSLKLTEGKQKDGSLPSMDEDDREDGGCDAQAPHLEADSNVASNDDFKEEEDSHVANEDNIEGTNILVASPESGGKRRRSRSHCAEEEIKEAPLLNPMEIDDDVHEEDAGMALEDDATRRSGGKRKRGRQAKSQVGRAPGRRKDEEEVCFICFDGGDLVVCDRRGCPKVYHPACVNREESFFRSKGRWNCGWHICSICQKASHIMCYTCTYSLCKRCIKEAVGFICVRGTKGFCDTCLSTVMLIEKNEHAIDKMEGAEFDDENSWMYMFKAYWLGLKRKLSLTYDELDKARTSRKGLNASAANEESEELYDSKNDRGAGSDSSSGHRGRKVSLRKKGKKRLRKNSNEILLENEIDNNIASAPEDTDWASKELLDLVAYMRNGDKSLLSQFDVQNLLLEYIKQNNLRDPRRKSQILCDAMLQNLFGKPRVGHFEMLKLLESHFLVKENSQPVTDDSQGGVVDPDSSQVEAEGNSDASTKMSSDKKRKARKQSEDRELHNSLDDYAAIDVHNIGLLYLRRNLMEELLDEVESFEEKVVGSFVRIRISGSGQRQDMYRLVQVIGTRKAAEKYKVGKKLTDTLLEILNLDKTEVITIDIISNQDFTEEECKRLRQSIKCGLIGRLTVGEVQEKARALQAVRVNDWLESEKSRLGHLRDRASEQGRRKQLRECVEKLQLLSTPEERARRLNEVPDIHADPNMDPDYESAEDETVRDVKRDSHDKAVDYSPFKKGREATSPGGTISLSGASWLRRGSNIGKEPNISIQTEGSREQIDVPSTSDKLLSHATDVQPSRQVQKLSTSASMAVPAPSSISETEKMWNYIDPSGKIQGPFSMTQLRKWSTTGYFPSTLRIWRTGEKEEDSFLLTDALNGKFHKALRPLEAQQNTKPDSGISWQGNWSVNTNPAAGNTGAVKAEHWGGSNARSGQQDHNSPRPGDIYAGNQYRSPQYPGRSGRGGNSSRWPSGNQDRGNSWSANRSRGIHPGSEGSETQQSNWNPSGQQPSGENWNSQPGNAPSNQWPNNSYGVSTPTPQPTSVGWMGGQILPNQSSSFAQTPVVTNIPNTTMAVPCPVAGWGLTAASMPNIGAMLQTINAAQYSGVNALSNLQTSVQQNNPLGLDVSDNKKGSNPNFSTRVSDTTDSRRAQESNYPSPTPKQDQQAANCNLISIDQKSPSEFNEQNDRPDDVKKGDFQIVQSDASKISFTQAGSLEQQDRSTSSASMSLKVLIPDGDPGAMKGQSSSGKEAPVTKSGSDSQVWSPISSPKQESHGLGLPPAQMNIWQRNQTEKLGPNIPGHEHANSGNQGAQYETKGSECSMPSPTPPSKPSDGTDQTHQLRACDNSRSSVSSEPGAAVSNEQPKTSWGVVPQNLNPVSGQAPVQGNMNWGPPLQGNVNYGWGAMVPASMNLAWGVPPQGNVNVNTGFMATPQANVTVNPAWSIPTQANNASAVWGSSAQGIATVNPGFNMYPNVNSVSAPVNTAQNPNWGAPAQANSNINAGWGAGPGTMNMPMDPSARNPNSWNSQEQHGGTDSSRQGGRSFHGTDPTRNRVQPNDPSRAQTGICWFYENGHCKKGTYCNMIHR